MCIQENKVFMIILDNNIKSELVRHNWIKRTQNF
jgi:hypothetical protein